MNAPDLSFSYCTPGSAVGEQAWNQLTIPPGFSERPILYGHDAIKSTFDEVEWMIVTGGVPYNDEDQFRLWFLNLTHADMYNEERWLSVNTKQEASTAQGCPSYVGPKDDEWDRSNLWDYAVECLPSPRQDHLTAIVNDDLFLFGGYSSSFDRDDYVYRLSLADIFSHGTLGFDATSNMTTINTDASWKRIMPRNIILTDDNTHTPLRGALWQQETEDLPKLVVATIPRHNSGNPDDDDFYYHRSSQEQGAIWTYDFSEDTWEVLISSFEYAYRFTDYRAIIHNGIFFLSGVYLEGQSTSMPYVWINLETKFSSATWSDSPMSGINQTLVAYNDVEQTDSTNPSSILIGFGPTLGNGLNLMVSRIEIDQLVNVDPIPLDNIPLAKGPVSRGGHTAVLSLYGNMYIFGGYLPQYSEAIWRVDVGGYHCLLQEKPKSHGHGDYDDDWNHGYDEDNYDDEDQGNAGPIAILPIVLLLLIFTKYREQQQDISEQRDLGQQNNGLTPQQLATFPVRVLDAGTEDQVSGGDAGNNDTNEGSCSICLVAFERGDLVRDLPCKHFFHKECVDNWLQSETTCPLCRISLKPTTDTESSLPNSMPSFGATIVQSLRGDDREPGATATPDERNETIRGRLSRFFRGTPLEMHDTEEHQENSVEMGSVYSLELREEDNNGDNDDDRSVLSSNSTRSRQSVYSSTSHSVNDNERRRRRRRRRLRSHQNSDGATPLTTAEEAEGSVMA